MVKSYFSLYRNAKKLYDLGTIKITDVKTNAGGVTDFDCYYFSCGEHNPMLGIGKAGHYWTRTWSCDCTVNSLNQKVECIHVKACELFLMNGGFNGKKATQETSEG